MLIGIMGVCQVFSQLGLEAKASCRRMVGVEKEMGQQDPLVSLLLLSFPPFPKARLGKPDASPV